LEGKKIIENDDGSSKSWGIITLQKYISIDETSVKYVSVFIIYFNFLVVLIKLNNRLKK